MRVFISVELPDEIKKKVAEATAPLKEIESGIKWVEDRNLHITLKFLGWVEDRKIDNMISLTEESAQGTGSFKLKFAGLGTFPGGGSPRVVWIGITEGGEKLKLIAEKLENNFSSAGFRSEEREFSAHLTIGRVKDLPAGRHGKKGVDKVVEKMDILKNKSFGEMAVKHISIMKSALSPKGPVYEKIKEVKL